MANFDTTQPPRHSHKKGAFQFGLRELFLLCAFTAVVTWLAFPRHTKFGGTFDLQLQPESMTGLTVERVNYLPVWTEAERELLTNDPTTKQPYGHCERNGNRFTAVFDFFGTYDQVSGDISYRRPKHCLLQIEYEDGTHHFQMIEVPAARPSGGVVEILVP